MNHKKIVIFYREYNPKETIQANLENTIVAHHVERSVLNADICYVLQAIQLIAEIWELKLSEKQDFTTARNILINSVLKN
jgi:hypothetical protein